MASPKSTQEFVLWAAVIRDQTLLVEAPDNATLEEEVSTTVRGLLNREPTSGWDLYSHKHWLSSIKGLKLHVYEDIDEEEPRIWTFACAFCSRSLGRTQAKSFLEKVAMIVEVLKDSDDTWTKGGHHACEDMFAAVLRQRMAEMTYMGKMAVADEDLDYSNKVIAQNKVVIDNHENKMAKLIAKMEEMNRSLKASKSEDLRETSDASERSSSFRERSSALVSTLAATIPNLNLASERSESSRRSNKVVVAESDGDGSGHDADVELSSDSDESSLSPNLLVSPISTDLFSLDELSAEVGKENMKEAGALVSKKWWHFSKNSKSTEPTEEDVDSNLGKLSFDQVVDHIVEEAIGKLGKKGDNRSIAWREPTSKMIEEVHVPNDDHGTFPDHTSTLTEPRDSTEDEPSCFAGCFGRLLPRNRSAMV